MSGQQEQDSTRTITSLNDVLGEELLSALLLIPTKEVLALIRGREQATTSTVARVAYLSKVLEYLWSTYNAFGIQRWFKRPRGLLDGRSPLEHLLSTTDWTPDDETAIEVAELARASNHFLAT